MRFTFDANVLVYAYDEQGGDKPRLADGLLRRAVRRDCVLTVQTLGEFFFAATRRRRVSEPRAHEAVARIRRAFPIVAADEECLSHALDAVRDHRIPFWDALFWATAQKAGCEVLFSEDLQDGRRLGRVLILNPFDEKNRVLLDAALPPAD